MSPQPNYTGVDDDLSLRWLIRSLSQAVLDSLRRNKIAAGLAAATALVLIALTFNSRTDGVLHYREFILPRLLRVESGFLASLSSAEKASGAWRGYYFENAHRQVRDILRIARLDRPQGYVARGKHREFIRYYESLDREFNAIGLEMTANPTRDYLPALAQRINELKPMRDSWARWAYPADGQ